MRIIVTMSTALFAALSLAASSWAVPDLLFNRAAELYRDVEAYRVYAAIFPEDRAYTNATSTVIIRGQTIPYSSMRIAFPAECLDPGPKYKALVDPAITDYRRVNRSRWKLARLFDVNKPYEFASENDFTGLWLKMSSPLGEYARNHRDFPGFIELSAVGFNAERR